MSIDIQKIIQLYDNILTILQVKQNLYIDNSQLHAFIQRYDGKKFEEKNVCVDFIEDAIIKIIRTWQKKLDLYKCFIDVHKHSYTQLQFKVDNLKNNNQILTKQDQLVADIQSIIRQWKQNMNPIDYYSIKQRKITKSNIEEKLKILKNNSNITKETNTPLYTRKIENDFKQNVLAAYYEQSKADGEIIGFTIQIHTQLAGLLGKLDKDIDMAEIPNFIGTQKSQFTKQVYELLSRNSKPTDRRLRAYNDSLNQAIRKNYQYWALFRKSLQNLIAVLTEFHLTISKARSNFDEKQQKIYKILVEIPASIGNIFRVNIIYGLIKSFNSIYGVYSIINSLKEKLTKRKDYCLKMEIQCRNFLNKIIQENSQKNHNFHQYVVEDKHFFQEQAKAQRVVTRSLLQTFKQSLEECYKLTMGIHNKFAQQCKIIQLLEPHELNPYLTKMIVSDSDDLLNGSINEKSMKISGIYTSQNKKSQQRMKKIEDFLNSVYVFDSHQQINQDLVKFSCALGPKFLLHGKLYIHSDGLYFQSQFNKKNLFFGKTKLFIPKNEIIQIDTRNTLLIFPDAVVIKSQHGLVSFHALGQQKIIREAITQAYLGEPIVVEGNGNQNQNQPQFKPFDESKRRNENQSMKLLEPLQCMINETFFKGSKANQMFRKYFSDDKFDIDGKQYDNFKSYFLLQIQALNPKSNSINPLPPSYFCYTTQDSPNDHFPLTSQRLHTYIKILPKIPFLSKGGQGQCEQIQTYHWFSPELFVYDILSIVKGFSLIEGMKIYIRTVVREIGDGVKMTTTAQIKFDKQSSTNGLVKSPALSNLKQSYAKMSSIIQKYERSSKINSKSEKTMNKQGLINAKSEKAETTMDDDIPITERSIIQIQVSKSNLQYIIIGVILFYIFSLFMVKIF